jgi:hypothetical protein
VSVVGMLRYMGTARAFGGEGVGEAVGAVRVEGGGEGGRGVWGADSHQAGARCR